MADTVHDTINQMLETLIRDVDGQVIDRSRVVDNLLDLRIVCDGLDPVVAAVDESLRSVPGKSLVTSDWWIATLHHVMTTTTPVGSRP